MHRLIIFARYLLMLILLAAWLPGCDVTQQARQASALANCDFRILSVENVTLAGVSFQHVKSVSDLGMTEMAILLSAFTAPTYPLTMQLNLEGRNPNDKTAGLNMLDWILFIDDLQMTSGTLSQPFTIPARGSSRIPVQVAVDIKQVLSGQSSQAILNFCLNLAGVGNTPTRFKIKLKPTITVAGVPLKYPGYITVNTTYSGK